MSTKKDPEIIPGKLDGEPQDPVPPVVHHRPAKERRPHSCQSWPHWAELYVSNYKESRVKLFAYYVDV